MNKLFIEAGHKNTSESHFLKAIIKTHFPDKQVEFEYMDGLGNLFNETIINQIKVAQTEGDAVLVFVDCDTIEKKGGYDKRKAYIDKKSQENGIVFPYFLYPDNHSDGEVEQLMSAVARRDLHKLFFDCFEDYENCIKGAKDKATGELMYKAPDIKSKLNAYIRSQRLSSRVRSRIGGGDWLFENTNYWDLSSEKLKPLIDFLKANLR